MCDRDCVVLCCVFCLCVWFFVVVFLLLFVFVMCLVCTMLPLSLDFPFLIALRFPLAFIYPIPSRFLYRYVYIVERFSVLNMHELFAAVCKVTTNQFNNFYNWIYNNIFKNRVQHIVISSYSTLVVPWSSWQIANNNRLILSKPISATAIITIAESIHYIRVDISKSYIHLQLWGVYIYIYVCVLLSFYTIWRCFCIVNDSSSCLYRKLILRPNWWRSNIINMYFTKN
jgi:hypothetical protein